MDEIEDVTAANAQTGTGLGSGDEVGNSEVIHLIIIPTDVAGIASRRSTRRGTYTITIDQFSGTISLFWYNARTKDGENGYQALWQGECGADLHQDLARPAFTMLAHCLSRQIAIRLLPRFTQHLPHEMEPNTDITISAAELREWARIELEPETRAKGAIRR